jgi:hypothetical protein
MYSAVLGYLQFNYVLPDYLGYKAVPDYLRYGTLPGYVKYCAGLTGTTKV